MKYFTLPSPSFSSHHTKSFIPTLHTNSFIPTLHTNSFIPTHLYQLFIPTHSYQPARGSLSWARHKAELLYHGERANARTAHAARKPQDWRCVHTTPAGRCRPAREKSLLLFVTSAAVLHIDESCRLLPGCGDRHHDYACHTLPHCRSCHSLCIISADSRR